MTMGAFSPSLMLALVSGILTLYACAACASIESQHNRGETVGVFDTVLAVACGVGAIAAAFAAGALWP